MRPDESTRQAVADAVRRGLECFRTGRKPARPAVPADLRQATAASIARGLAKFKTPERGGGV